MPPPSKRQKAGKRVYEKRLKQREDVWVVHSDREEEWEEVDAMESVDGLVIVKEDWELLDMDLNINKLLKWKPDAKPGRSFYTGTYFH